MRVDHLVRRACRVPQLSRCALVGIAFHIQVSAQLRAAELSERHNLEIREELRLHNEAARRTLVASLLFLVAS